MTARVYHLNCGVLHAPPNPRASCHCLLIQEDNRLAIIDSGIGLADVTNPIQRIGQQLIDLAGFQFRDSDTAVRQIEGMGFQATDVKHVVLTHGDPDHTGGLADFPNAVVHVAAEEHAQIATGHWRYLQAHFHHQPRWRTYGAAAGDWFGLEARPVALGWDTKVFLIPLRGHTQGHCGVAVQMDGRWLLHVGDAYYLRVELTTDDHPVSTLAAQRADDDSLRRVSLAHLRHTARDHAGEVEMFGYHDFTEFPHGESSVLMSSSGLQRT